MAAFLLFNICNNRLLPKVFLGDAGSKLIGFTLVWLLTALYMTGIERTRLLARALLGQETGEQQHG